MLNMEACKTLGQELVISHLDYSNAILAGLLENTIKKLHRVQNIAAKIILNRDRRTSVTECLKQLNWLEMVRDRIRHKTLTLVHKCLMGNAPMYVQDLLQEHEGGRRHLRSNIKHKHLQIPHIKKKTFAARSFSILGPVLWNELPNELKEVDNTSNFKRKLKTHLFREVYCSTHTLNSAYNEVALTKNWL